MGIGDFSAPYNTIARPTHIHAIHVMLCSLNELPDMMILIPTNIMIADDVANYFKSKASEFRLSTSTE